LKLEINTLKPQSEQGQCLVSVHDFQHLRILGEGGFGKVALVQKIGGHDHRVVYAMKVLEKDFSCEVTNTELCEFGMIENKNLPYPSDILPLQPILITESAAGATASHISAYRHGAS
jgi:hypothetical protein